MRSMSQRIEGVKAAFASKEAFLKAIETKSEKHDPEAERNPWSNEDLAISPPEDRTWSWYS